MPRVIAVLTALLLGLVTVSCAQESDEHALGVETSGDDSAGAAESDDGSGDDTSDDSAGASGSIEWEDCGELECAEVEVPLDYDDPEGETIEVSVARSPATGDRIGPLFVNPGGPGASATELVSSLTFMAPAEITERFDIVGVDPRGIGASSIDCGGDFQELYGVDYSIDSEEDETTLLDVSQEYVDGCEADVGEDLLANMGTRDVARDMDTVREAMGDDQLSYLGYSYGTAIGQVYAEEFPDQVRAMVIDGVLELGPTGIETAQEQARGFERALEAFADDCNADDSCPLAPDALAALDELSQQVEEEPIAAEPRDLGPGELSTGLALPLYDEFLWPDLASAIANALDGDGTDMVRLADEYLNFGNFDVYFGVDCLDFEWPDDPAELLDAGAAMEEEAPHFGASIVNDYVRCSMWPVEAEPLEAVTAPGTPPILVISTTGDPATPYEAGVRTADQLESGVLLTHEGDGHTVAFTGNSCVDDAVVTYFVDVEPPEDETTCD